MRLRNLAAPVAATIAVLAVTGTASAVAASAPAKVGDGSITVHFNSAPSPKFASAYCSHAGFGTFAIASTKTTNWNSELSHLPQAEYELRDGEGNFVTKWEALAGIKTKDHKHAAYYTIKKDGDRYVGTGLFVKVTIDPNTGKVIPTNTYTKGTVTAVCPSFGAGA